LELRNFFISNVIRNNEKFLLNNPIALQKRYNQVLNDPNVPLQIKKKSRRSVDAAEEEAVEVLAQMFDWLDTLDPLPTKEIISLYQQSQMIETEIQNTLAVMRQIAEADKKAGEVQRKLDGAHMVG
jgi:hypothetical protein